MGGLLFWKLKCIHEYTYVCKILLSRVNRSLKRSRWTKCVRLYKHTNIFKCYKNMSDVEYYRFNNLENWTLPTFLLTWSKQQVCVTRCPNDKFKHTFFADPLTQVLWWVVFGFDLEIWKNASIWTTGCGAPSMRRLLGFNYLSNQEILIIDNSIPAKIIKSDILDKAPLFSIIKYQCFHFICFKWNFLLIPWGLDFSRISWLIVRV